MKGAGSRPYSKAKQDSQARGVLFVWSSGKTVQTYLLSGCSCCDCLISGWDEITWASWLVGVVTSAAGEVEKGGGTVVTTASTTTRVRLLLHNLFNVRVFLIWFCLKGDWRAWSGVRGRKKTVLVGVVKCYMHCVEPFRLTDELTKQMYLQVLTARGKKMWKFGSTTEYPFLQG